jgi:hypothetical protein
MKLLLTACLLMGLTLSAADVSGTWAGKYDVVIGDGQTMKGKVTLNLTQTGSELTGNVGSDEGQMKIQNGKVEGDKVTFEVQTEGPKIVFDLRVERDRLVGGGSGESDGSKVQVKIELARGA